MRSVEVEGDSIDDAIRRALVELGVPRDRASIEILNDATRGILGFGGRKARVKASVRAPLSVSLGTLDDRVPRRVSRETARAGDEVEKRQRPDHMAAQPSPAARHPDVHPPVSRETRQPDHGLAPNIAASVVVSDRPETEPNPEMVSRPATSTLPSATGDLAIRSRGVLVELLSHMGLQCEVSCELAVEDGDAVVMAAVRGDSSALLIGKHGQTLDAIEYILNRIVIRESGSTARIEVDVEGYRARRAESLISTARRMAERVRETGRPATVDPMSPRDRRIVHMALKKVGGVTSRSQGEGFLRKLVILPAGKRRNVPRSARDGE